MKANATSRVPDCFQKLPRRINIPENGSQILSLAIDGLGKWFNVFFSKFSPFFASKEEHETFEVKVSHRSHRTKKLK